MTDTVRWKLLAMAALLLGQGACTSVHDPAGPEPESAATEVAVPAAVPLREAESLPLPQRYGNFTREQLAELILAELGGQRGELDEAAQRYHTLARDTDDTGVIARAAEFASVAGQTSTAAELASIWVQRDADNIDPRLILSYQLLDTGQLEAAMEQMATILQLGGRADFTSLSARSPSLPPDRARALQQDMALLLERYPGESSLYHAQAQMLDQQGRREDASEMLDRARERFGDTPRTLIVEAQLLQNRGQGRQALELLAEGVERYSRHRLIRYNYAQMLLENDLLRPAREQFNILTQLAPDDPETLYSLALLNLELGEPDAAESQLQTLLAQGNRVNEARFYMGYLENMRGNTDPALHWYKQVNRHSPAHTTAQRQIMQLLLREQRFEDARQHTRDVAADTPELEPMLGALEAEVLANTGNRDGAVAVLDDILDRQPDNIDLLFARSLLNDRREDIPAVERDLRHILELRPDSARALNHLGYTLTLHTERYDEALDLIERAIAIEPDDPAIIDSLGWVQYKLGMLEEALENLRRAYAEFPNHEVAAHLGEVLWVSGEEEQAMDVWLDALEQTPDSEHLQEVLDRFAP